MSGIVIPSLLDRRLMETRATLQQIADRSKFDERGIHRLGNGMSVTREGAVLLEPRSQAPTQTEQEEMAYTFLKFAEFLKSAGASQIAAEQRSQAGLVTHTQTDPLITPQPVIAPADLTLEFGTPIDTTEIITLCEETGLYESIPEVVNGSKTESWRELTALQFASGTNWIGFTAGGCPEFGDIGTTTTTNSTIDKKHIGQMTTLTESDIQHSIASIAAGYGVRQLVGPSAVTGVPTFVREGIKSLQDKEIKKQMINVINGWDFLLAKGNAESRTLEFNGIENYITTGNGARINTLLSAYTGTFSATRFDEWLAAGCAKPTHILGHPTALQALKLGYWGLGANSGPAQVVNFNAPGKGLVAGLSFADSIMTSVGPLPLVADSRFTRTDHSNGTFTADLYAVRMVHNGEPLIYKASQIPLSYKELAPGCSAISFMTWAVTALVVKYMCAQARYTARFAGLVQNGCNYVFGS